MNSEIVLKGLNDEQKQAVIHEDGPLLIVAGAGTGKTTVITRRIAWLILSEKCKTNELLALTFTEKAAGEMEERVDRLLPYGYVHLWISTFHAFCDRILKNHGLDIGLSNDYKLLDQTALWLLMRKNIDRFDLEYYRPLGNPTKSIHALIKHFSRAKDEEITPEHYLDYAEKKSLNQDTVPQSGDNEMETRRILEVAKAYHTYEQILFENQCLDFGSLISYTLKLFRTRPSILEKYRKQFKYILVDEFQDTNWAQYELIKLLAAPKNNVTVVGDDDQCLPGSTRISLANGKKKNIRDIRKGEAVLTGVGKGHIGISRVTHIWKRAREQEIVTVETKRGFKITATKNHKFFCYVPNFNDKRFHYVYLMFKKNIGWRMGVTNNLVLRLRLERSADLIIGLKACNTDQEARYYETFWSLHYGIPTVCFKERTGIIIKNTLLKRLYQNLDVENRVKKCADDLGISLDIPHWCLDGVTRGSQQRLKIHVQMCYRAYRSKDHVVKGKELLLNPCIMHQLTLETSNQEAIYILEKNGYTLQRSKKGKRLRMTSTDHEILRNRAEKIKRLTNGFIEVTCAIGKYKRQHLPAKILPASNLLAGHFIPIKVNNGIEYDEIISVQKKKSNQVFYDLEIEKTHNFIANSIVVHNSVYKFRGASIANVLEFKKDFPQSKKIVLVKNYRSTQKILDASYQFIQQNNPNRLEFQERLPKKLEAVTAEVGDIHLIHSETQEEETERVMQAIVTLKEKQSELSWGDFALLVRSHNAAAPFLSSLEKWGIPYVFLSQKGLYAKPIILDIIAYCRVLFNPHESPSLYRVFTQAVVRCSAHALQELSHAAKKQATSIWDMALKIDTLSVISEEDRKELSRVTACIQHHASLVRTAKPVELFLKIIKEQGILDIVKQETSETSRESLRYLIQFFGKVKRFCAEYPSARLNDFCELISLEQEAGDEGTLAPDSESGPDTVKVMTVHASKGLEFEAVFLVNLVDRRFPSIERNDAIEVPVELIKEILLEGDIHLEEERRLFYVGMTRAKRFLYFTLSRDADSTRRRKPSQFLYELGIVQPSSEEEQNQKKQQSQQSFSAEGEYARESRSAQSSYHIPSRVSFSQLAAFQTCPLQYKFAFVLKIPTFGKPMFSFGKTLHSTLQKFFEAARERSGYTQVSLFTKSDQGYTNKKEIILPSFDDLIVFYDSCWLDEWYGSKRQKEEYYQKGKKMLKSFYDDVCEHPRIPKYLEQDFSLKIGGCDSTLKGRIDRVDEVNGGVEIIDYKTGASKAEKGLTADDKRQLLLYQLAAEKVLGEHVVQLTYYYLEDGAKVSFVGSEKDKEKCEKTIKETVEKMSTSDFAAKPGWHCTYCDFKDICEFRKIS